MFKKPSVKKAPPRGDAADLHVEPSKLLVPWDLYPRHALQQKLGRAPKTSGPHIRPHPYRPPVLASERLFLWVSPASITKRQHLTNKFSPSQLLTYDNALCASLAIGTRQLYGSALIDWIQWCDSSNIPEHRRLPISSDDLRMFIAHKVGVEGASKTTNTLAGLRMWHIIQDVHWPDDPVLTNLRRAAASHAPPATHRPPRPPVTIAHLAALRQHLNLLDSPCDIAIFACACTAFWGVNRLGELICPISDHEPSHRVRCSCNMSYAPMDPTRSYPPSLDFHIPWTKSTKSSGANVHLSDWDDKGQDTSAIKALAWHLRFSAHLPDSAPLFAYSSSPDYTPLTRSTFLKRCKTVWSISGLGDCSGHSFRIGGTTELLKRGVSHDVVKIQGRWASDAWQLYIRHHPEILELEYQKTRARVLSVYSDT